MSCDRCAVGERERPAIARCRFCSFALCSEHLDDVFAPRFDRPSSGCRHVFVATGWLEWALHA